MENLGNGETEEEWERCTGAKFDLQICEKNYTQAHFPATWGLLIEI